MLEYEVYVVTDKKVNDRDYIEFSFSTERF